MCVVKKEKFIFDIKNSNKLRPFSSKYRIQIGGIRIKLSKQKFFNRLNKGCFLLYRKNKSYNLFVRSFAYNIYSNKSLRRKKWYLLKITRRQSVRLKYINLYRKFFNLEINLNVFYSHRSYLLNFRFVNFVQLKYKQKLTKLFRKHINYKRSFENRYMRFRRIKNSYSNYNKKNNRMRNSYSNYNKKKNKK